MRKLLCPLSLCWTVLYLTVAPSSPLKHAIHSVKKEMFLIVATLSVALNIWGVHFNVIMLLLLFTKLRNDLVIRHLYNNLFKVFNVLQIHYSIFLINTLLQWNHTSENVFCLKCTYLFNQREMYSLIFTFLPENYAYCKSYYTQIIAIMYLTGSVRLLLSGSRSLILLHGRWTQ